MPPRSAECQKCKGAMEGGWLWDTFWFPSQPAGERASWLRRALRSLGSTLKGRTVIAMRCTQCGALELYVDR